MKRRQIRAILAKVPASPGVTVYLVGDDEPAAGPAIYDETLGLVVVNDVFYIDPKRIAAIAGFVNPAEQCEDNATANRAAA